MNLDYKVHAAYEQEVSCLVTLEDGRQVEAKVAGLVVELVSCCGLMTSMLRLTPTDMAAAKALFPVGGEVVATFAAPAV